MKIGDLVRPRSEFVSQPDEEEWLGIVIGWADSNPIVFWSSVFPCENEYEHQLELMYESR